MLAVRSRGRVAEAGGVRPPSQPLLLCWCRYQFTHHSSLITLYSLLFTHHSSLITLHSSLFTHHSSLFTLHSSLITLHSSLITLHSSLFTLHSSLFTHHSSLITLHSSLFTLHSSLFTLHFFTHHIFTHHFFTTLPDFMTKLTCSIRDMSASGSPATAIKSAERPGSIDPSSSVAPSIVAALIVADWIACMGVMPYLTM